MPVETQNLASPEEDCAIYSCYNRHVVIAFIACETQDFASLLFSMRRNELAVGVVSWRCRGAVWVQKQRCAVVVLG